MLATQPVIGSNLALANIDTTAGTPNHLRVTLQLPGTADNSYQNQSSVIGYVFAGTQRNATDR